MVQTVISDYMSPNCDPELEDGKPIFLHDDTLVAHDDSSLYNTKFGYRNLVQQLRKYRPDEHSLEF